MTRVFALFDHIFDLNAISPELVYKTYYNLVNSLLPPRPFGPRWLSPAPLK